MEEDAHRGDERAGGCRGCGAAHAVGMETQGGGCTHRGGCTQGGGDAHVAGGMHMQKGCTYKWAAAMRELHMAEGCTCEGAHASGMQMPEGCAHRKGAHTQQGGVHTRGDHTHTCTQDALARGNGLLLLVVVRNMRQKFLGSLCHPLAARASPALPSLPSLWGTVQGQAPSWAGSSGTPLAAAMEAQAWDAQGEPPWHPGAVCAGVGSGCSAEPRVNTGGLAGTQ